RRGMLPRLELVSRRGDAPHWEDGRVVLQQGVGWTLRGDATTIQRAARVLGSLAEPVGANVLLVDFGNAVGHLDIPGVGPVEIVSGKWTRGDHEAMLQELSVIAGALPFTAGSPTSFPYDRSVVDQPDLRYHAFVYLRHVLSDAAPRDEQLLP